MARPFIAPLLILRFFYDVSEQSSQPTFDSQILERVLLIFQEIQTCRYVAMP
jgi:hypothetical protein